MENGSTGATISTWTVMPGEVVGCNSDNFDLVPTNDFYDVTVESTTVYIEESDGE